jgi:hypothetical protein
MSKTMKIGLTVGAVFVVLAAGGALLYFSGGGPFKGQVTAPEGLKYAPMELCPTDYYAPKASAYRTESKYDLSVAKAQLLPFTPEGLTAADTARDTVNAINTDTARLINEADLDGTVETAGQPGIITLSATAQDEADLDGTVETAGQPGIITLSATAQDEADLDGTVETAGTDDRRTGDGGEIAIPLDVPGTDKTDVSIVGANIPEGCNPIPHDNLTPGMDQCGLIDQLYMDPAGYRLNEETKAHLEEWHARCNPPVAVETTQLCGENQEAGPVGAATCVCKAGYFDVSSALSTGMTTNDVTGLPMETTNPFVGTAMDTQIPQTDITCWNCDMLQSQLADYRKQLDTVTTVDEKTIIEKRISDLEDIAARNECKPPVAECAANEVRDVAGACVCAANFKKTAAANICVYDCDSVVGMITDMRASRTTYSDAKLIEQMNDLVTEATANGCKVPDETTECDRYLEDSNDAFNSLDYDLFYEISGQYVDKNCSGRTETDCEKILAKGVSVNRILNTIPGSATAPAKYEEELESLKARYYADERCNNTETRCAELEKTLGVAGAPSAPTDIRIDQPTDKIDPTKVETLRLSDLTIKDQVTPGNVFKDDLEYYDTYCKEKELSCDEVRAIMTIDDIRLLDVGSDLRTKYESCLAVPDISATQAETMERREPPGPTPMNPPTPTQEAPPVVVETQTQVETIEVVEVVNNPPPASNPPPPSAPKVETETATIDIAKVSAPAPIADSPAVSQEETITPAAPVETVRPAAPEVTAPTYEEVPPEITPTGPESFIYLAGLALGQLIFFRRKIFAWLVG